MTVKVNGKLFSGVTYNQGSFSGDRGHIFIAGQIQCSSQLNLLAKNRIWQEVKKKETLSNLIESGSICKICAKKTKDLIEQAGK